MNHLIIIPGLGGSNPYFEYICSYWNTSEINVHVYDFEWRNKKNNFEYKINGLLDLIDAIPRKSKVFLIGTSAGGSAAINAFSRKKTRISKVVNICGRLRSGKNVYPSLKDASTTSKSFKESVLKCEIVSKKFNVLECKKILTISPYFDEIVPTSTMTLNKANNARIFSATHFLSIFLSMTFYSGIIKKFLRS